MVHHLSKEQAESLASDLDRRAIRKLPGSGGRPALDYISTQTAINNANRIFGYEGWTYEAGDIVEVGRRPYQRYRKDNNGNTQKYEQTAVLFRVKVTVTVAGVPRSDYGTCIAPDDKFELLETAMKGAVSDGIKRAFRSFGPQFGLSLYEKADETALRVSAGLSPLYDTEADTSAPQPPARSEMTHTAEELGEGQADWDGFSDGADQPPAQQAPPRPPRRQEPRQEKPAGNQPPPRPAVGTSTRAMDQISEDSLQDIIQNYRNWSSAGQDDSILDEFMREKFGNPRFDGSNWHDNMEERFSQLTNGQAAVIKREILDKVPF